MRPYRVLSLALAAAAGALVAAPASGTSPREMQVSVARGKEAVPAVPRGDPRGAPLRVAGGIRLRIGTSKLVARTRVWLADSSGRRFGPAVRAHGLGPATGGSTRTQFRVRLPSRIPRRTGVLVLGFQRRDAAEKLYEIAVCGRFSPCR